jgi:hypothetical protein
MNPIKLFSQFFGKSVPPIMATLFTFYFFLKYNECGDVLISLKHAAGKTLL